MSRARAVVVAITTLLAFAPSAQAITSNGSPDLGRHPEVVALVGLYSGIYDSYCTGTLVSSTVVLTASHCVSYGQSLGRARISTAEAMPTTSTLEGTFVLNPAYDPRQTYLHDVSAIVLDAPVAGVTPALLPPTGLLDRMKADGSLATTEFTVAGYGTREQATYPGYGHYFPASPGRGFARLGYHALDKRILHEDQNLARGYEGACYGDSGGPSFLGTGTAETDVVVGVTSSGDGPCYSTNTATRTDTAEAKALLSTLGVPIPAS